MMTVQDVVGTIVGLGIGFGLEWLCVKAYETWKSRRGIAPEQP